MINNVNKHTIADIFGVDSSVKYMIPKFQREYTWNKDNWSDLMDDIIDSDGSHFVGSIICIKRPDTDIYNPELELIDGQQRLTTISLLFCAIYKTLQDKAPVNDNDFIADLSNLKWKLIQRTGNDYKLELSKQNNNFSDYRSVLNEIGIKDFNEQIGNKGNRRIYKCFRYFLGKIEENTIEEVLKFLEKIGNTLLVKIEVDSHSDAFMLFESLNNRGVPLSAIDLIKNKLLSELERTENITTDEAFGKWKKIIEYLPEYTIQERFLRHFYNAYKNQEDIKVDGATKAIRSNLIKIYETLIERDPEKIFHNLSEKSKIYHDLLTPEEENLVISDKLDRELIDLINVKAAPSYALLLFLFSLEEKKDDIDFFRRVIRLLVKYFIRRNITDFPNTRNLDQIFIDLIEDISSDNSKANYDFIYNFLSDDGRISSLSTFEEKLGGDIYELNVDATRFILSKIEETQRTDEIHTDFWTRDNNNKLIWTIEHIFPEGQNIPESWIDMIADGDIVKAKELQEKHVHELGNLTLTGYNQSLANFNFERKRDREDNNGNFIGYKNNLFLNEDLKDSEKWTIEDILKRKEKLISLAMSVFKLDNEVTDNL